MQLHPSEDGSSSAALTDGSSAKLSGDARQPYFAPRPALRGGSFSAPAATFSGEVSESQRLEMALAAADACIDDDDDDDEEKDAKGGEPTQLWWVGPDGVRRPLGTGTGTSTGGSTTPVKDNLQALVQDSGGDGGGDKAGTSTPPLRSALKSSDARQPYFAPRPALGGSFSAPAATFSGEVSESQRLEMALAAADACIDDDDDDDEEKDAKGGEPTQLWWVGPDGVRRPLGTGTGTSTGGSTTPVNDNL